MKEVFAELRCPLTEEKLSLGFFQLGIDSLEMNRITKRPVLTKTPNVHQERGRTRTELNLDLLTILPRNNSSFVSVRRRGRVCLDRSFRSNRCPREVKAQCLAGP